jgi:alpha-beta hydrolase superfamily lysophospholipase
MHKFPAQFERKIDGLVLSNFILKFEYSRLFKLLNPPLTHFVSRLRAQKVFHGPDMTSDDHHAILFEQDSLIVHRPTWSAINSIKEKLNMVYRDAYFLNWPILVLQSEHDKYIIKQGMEYFLKGIKKNLLTEKNYSNLKHDLYNETDKEMVFNDLVEWINKHEKIS